MYDKLQADMLAMWQACNGSEQWLHVFAGELRQITQRQVIPAWQHDVSD